ncbi:MAG: DUF58 domain-containing protein [Actinobacteria bacterium]|nr:DUF58 domain-containing protein [Actinomycetota bacterium]
MKPMLHMGHVRSPARPGPGDVSDDLLRSLDLRVSRRIAGLLSGEFPSLFTGAGIELSQIRMYHPGDDVREIDWNVTARTGFAHIRARVAERVLTTWLLIDGSPSMVFGTATRRKIDVAEGVALAVAYLGTRRGNRLGVMSFGGEHAMVLPPTAGRAGLLRVLSAMRKESHSAGAASTSIAHYMRRVAGVAGSRGVVVIVSDLMGPVEWRSELIQLTARHDVIVVEVRDPREYELTDVGEVWFVDPETGRRLRADTSSRELREHFAAAARADRADVARTITRAGAGHIILSTEGDWLRDFAHALAMRSGHR